MEWADTEDFAARVPVYLIPAKKAAANSCSAWSFSFIMSEADIV